MTNKLLQKKVCLLGAAGVGKTSLIRRFVYDIFDDTYLTTVGVKVTQKLMPPIQDAKNNMIQHNFLIWDIEGAIENGEVQKSYLTGASGALIVADVTREETAEVVPRLIKVFYETSPQGKILLIANKSDLLKPQSLDEMTLEMLFPHVKDNTLAYQYTSAKTGNHVEDAFKELSRLISQ